MGIENPDFLEAGIPSNSKKIEGWLDEEEQQRTVIAITGKSGAGKTTLATCIYRSVVVRRDFACVIWVDVPPRFRLRDLLSIIFQQDPGVAEDEEADRSGSEEAIKKELCARLHGKRYLIILDNVSSWEQWKFLLEVLPSGDTRNRVLITTQLSVEEMPTGSDRPCYFDEKLDLNKETDVTAGKKLFYKRVFGKKDFHERFQNAENNLEKLLSGSPLAITLLAGLLRSKKEEEWENVIEQLQRSSADKPGTSIGLGRQQQDEETKRRPGQEERPEKQPPQEEQQVTKKPTISLQYQQLPLSEKILLLSFDDLPPHLKQCFLYFAAFKAEVGIDAEKLVRLWIAEGFVQPTDRWTMEEHGHECLQMMVSRCLVNLVEKDNNNIVTVSIHERVLAFARSEARESNFLQFHMTTNNLASAGIRRLSLHNTFNPHMSMKPLANPKLRSLICSIPEANNNAKSSLWKKAMELVMPWIRPWTSGYIQGVVTELIIGRPADGFTMHRAKFLRVLDLKGVHHRGTIPKEIGWLIHLRYLGLAHSRLTSLPNTVKKLRNLQTLDILHTKILAVPQGFWKIQALRHVLAPNLSNGPCKVRALHCLRTLYGVPWGAWVKNCAMKGGFANLRSLRSWRLPNSKTLWEDLQAALASLDSLTSLELESDEQACLPLGELLTMLALRHLQHFRLHGVIVAEEKTVARSHPYLLPNLTKFELYKSNLREEHIAIIAALPNLRELILGENSYMAETLSIDQRFLELKKLQLHIQPNLVSLQVAELPQLQHVSIFNCTERTVISGHVTTYYWHNEISATYRVFTRNCRYIEGRHANRPGN